MKKKQIEAANLKRDDALEKVSPPAHNASLSDLPQITAAQSPVEILISPAIFWTPRHTLDSPLLSSIPFLFWLIEAMRPRKIVQLGLGDGVVYMAICQAVERLGGRSLCMGLELGQSRWQDVQRQSHEAEYSSFSQLLPRNTSYNLNRLIEGTDLLILNGALDSDQFAHISEQGLGNMSERCVVLVVDAANTLRTRTLYDRLLTDDRPVLRSGPMSLAGERVDLILYGAKQPDRLRALIEADEASDIQLTARQIFRRLGKGVIDAHRVTRMLRENIDSSGMDEASRLPAFLVPEAAQPAAAATRHQTELDELRAENESLREAHAERIEDIAVLTREFRSKLKIATDEAIELSKQCQKAKNIGMLVETTHAAQLKQIQEANDFDQSQLRTQLEELKQLHHSFTREIYESTSWRITRPMRAIKSAMTRK